ncbi:hypothetical protein E2562_011249 [Oryza meyeriana var. granulata]|uniref:Uncharacterized protein n=1 Tax=Oryza meyeriana var. granulata TaxID=110450 RepID=A0A6G1BUS1_9ORYZ|nr:hypothetical protein E2562_011249 [Oryza meyeriana var. granulata]
MRRAAATGRGNGATLRVGSPDGARDGVASEERAEEEAGAVEEQHHAAAAHQQKLQHACSCSLFRFPTSLAAESRFERVVIRK